MHVDVEKQPLTTSTWPSLSRSVHIYPCAIHYKYYNLVVVQYQYCQTKLHTYYIKSSSCGHSLRDTHNQTLKPLSFCLMMNEPNMRTNSSSSSHSCELRRGPWMIEEDNLLVQYITLNGEGRWNSLAKSAGIHACAPREEH